MQSVCTKLSASSCIGFVFNYCLEQVSIWAVLHATFLFWGVRFPFSYRQLKVRNKVRSAHIISVLLAVVVPLPAGLIHLRDGFVFTSNPSNGCTGRNLDLTFYTTVIPVSIIVGITACLLVVVLWILFKVYYMHQKYMYSSCV